MLVGELKTFNQTKGLIYIPADGQVVDGHLPQDSIGVDDEQSTEGNAFILLKNSVGLADDMGRVSKQRDVNVS